MARTINTDTLESFARHLAHSFLAEDRKLDDGVTYIDGPSYVMQDLQKLTFKDEFVFVVTAMREWMAQRAIAEFERLSGNYFTPRDDAVFHELLRTKLAIDPDGAHIPGVIGTTIVGARDMGMHFIDVESPDSIRYRKRKGLDRSHREVIVRPAKYRWPVYMGEEEERAADSGVADPLPGEHRPAGALNTRISNECALLACDAVVDNLDEGTGAAVIQPRTGAQPADPDTAPTGTVLGTLVCSATAFGAASDAAPGGVATAAAITSDTNADATDTIGYVRASSTNDGATPLDDHIDGEAGTSGADFNFNTLSVSAGATIAITSWTVTMPES